MNLENTVKKASQILKNHNIHSHELDAQIILSDIMGIKREFLITNNETNISKKVLEKYDIAIQRRIKKEPIAYIIGKKEFWSQDFKVNYSNIVNKILEKYKKLNVLNHPKKTFIDKSLENFFNIELILTLVSGGAYSLSLAPQTY